MKRQSRNICTADSKEREDPSVPSDMTFLLPASIYKLAHYFSITLAKNLSSPLGYFKQLYAAAPFYPLPWKILKS